MHIYRCDNIEHMRDILILITISSIITGVEQKIFSIFGAILVIFQDNSLLTIAITIVTSLAFYRRLRFFEGSRLITGSLIDGKNFRLISIKIVLYRIVTCEMSHSILGTIFIFSDLFREIFTILIQDKINL